MILCPQLKICVRLDTTAPFLYVYYTLWIVTEVDIAPQEFRFTPGIVILLFLFMPLSLPGHAVFAQEPQRVQVIVDYAHIRSEPALEAEILDVASKGDIFIITEKTGPWYKIEWSLDQAGRKTYGYLHENDTTILEPVAKPEPVIEEPQKPPAPVLKEPPPSKPAQPKQAPAEKAPPEKALSGSFIKFGQGDRWLVSTGLDFGIARNFALGFEIQPYYTSDSRLNQSVLTTSVFANAKLGVRFAFISIYTGGGIGPEFSFISKEIGGESVSEFDKKLAYHFMAGIELGSRAISLVVEGQMIRISDPEADTDKWTYFILVGLRL